MRGATMLIASRNLNLRSDESDTEIPIRLFAPVCEEDGSRECRYEVEWPDGTHAKTIFGFDAIQTLFLALQAIGAEIYGSDFHKSGKLFFETPAAGYGFPVMPPLRELLQSDDTKYL
jgi:Domain of unknown function (DUF6968)